MPTALVVDDESDAREFVRTLLEEEGYEVAEASDGDEALVSAKALVPDLMVLDVTMPKLNGLAVFGQLTKDPVTRDIKVIMLTGVGEVTGISYSAEDMGWFFGKEPAAYIEKPVSPEVFKRVLQQVTQGGEPPRATPCEGTDTP